MCVIFYNNKNAKVLVFIILKNEHTYLKKIENILQSKQDLNICKAINMSKVAILRNYIQSFFFLKTTIFGLSVFGEVNFERLSLYWGLNFFKELYVLGKFLSIGSLVRYLYL